MSHSSSSFATKVLHSGEVTMFSRSSKQCSVSTETDPPNKLPPGDPTGELFCLGNNVFLVEPVSAMRMYKVRKPF